jgi:23S rRNA (uracil1939-C5)-methyltransferase
MSEGEAILRLAGRGDGATASGRHVPLAVPGDIVMPDGTVLPGPDHVVPPCRHFPVCGGCQLQHVSDAAYSAFIVARIVGALAGQGIDAPDIAAVHLSPPHARRRIAMRAERRGRRVTLGFNEGASHSIVDIAQCEIMAPALFALIAPLRALMADLMPDRRAAEIQMTIADQGVDLLLSKIKADGLAAAERLTAFAQKHRLARVMIDEGDGPEVRWEPDAVTITLGGVPVPLPPGAFLQATTDGEAALVAEVRRGVGDAKTIADLFSGLGTFALPLAKQAKVYAAEGARDALLALKSASARAGLGLFADHRDLFRRPLAPAELERFDAIVLDPPRAGAKDQAANLAAVRVPRIVYVSCNPATFARDIKPLVENGYMLERITPIGQFRWSTHVELVATLRSA